MICISSVNSEWSRLSQVCRYVYVMSMKDNDWSDILSLIFSNRLTKLPQFLRVQKAKNASNKHAESPTEMLARQANNHKQTSYHVFIN